MADDEKVIRIEANINESTKKVSDKPDVASTNDTEPPTIPSLQEVTDRSAHEKFEKDRQDQLDLEKKIYSDLTKGEDDDLFSAEEVKRILTPFGDTEEPTVPDPTGNSGIPPVAPLNGPLPGTPGNPVPLPGGAGGGGTTPPGGGNPPPGGGGFGGLNNILPGGLGNIPLLPPGVSTTLLLDIGVVGGALLGFSASLLAAEEIVDSTFQGMAQAWKELSPGINVADALSELDLTVEKLKTEQQVAEPVAKVTAARTDMDRVWIDIKANLIEIIAPTLVQMMQLVTLILDILNALLVVVRIISKVNSFISDMVAKFVGLFVTLQDNDQRDMAFSKQIGQVFSDGTAVDPTKPLFGSTRPDPHALQKGTFYQ